jgi:hypothetical protein
MERPFPSSVVLRNYNLPRNAIIKFSIPLVPPFLPPPTRPQPPVPSTSYFFGSHPLSADAVVATIATSPVYETLPLSADISRLDGNRGYVS